MTETTDHRGQLETICNNATAALFIMDDQNQCTYMNPAAIELTGFQLEDVRGRPLHEFIHHSHPDGSPYPMDNCPIGHSLLAGEQARGEEVFVHKDGHYYHVAFAASLIREGDQVVGAVLEVQDITERKRAEEALRAANAQLLESDRRKDEFLAMLAHELRNPLAPIRNTVELLQTSADKDPQFQNCLQILRRQTASLSGLVDDLLDVSRITRGLIELKHEHLDLGIVVDRAMESAQFLMDDKHHQIVVTAPRRSVYVIGDSLRLEQILVNLLTNAAKYTDPEGRIDVIVEQHERNALLRVRDNGIGLEPDMLKRIFELFGQAQRGLDRSQGGLGIGLTIVEELVALHGGQVEAKSEGAGRGAEFVVTLPLAVVGERPATAGLGKLRNFSGHARRVLIVDDNADAAETLALLLEASGHQAAVAHDGARALSMVDEVQPELILLDIGLPSMDGYQIAELLRDNPRTKDATLAALTGYGQPEDVKRAHAAGFDRHFVKPLDIEVLLSLIDDLVATPAP